MNNYLKIYSIALKSREKAERIAKEDDYFNAKLAGFCARGSAILFNDLRQEGFRSKIVEGDLHFYIMCEGYVVDITATQYDICKKVYISKDAPVLADRRNPWFVFNKFNSIKSARKRQFNLNWEYKEIIKFSDLVI